MKIKKNQSLKKHTTFSTDVKAKYFAKIKNIEELKEILQKYPNEKILLLGEGSNTLLVDDWEGLTLKIEFKGREILRESKGRSGCAICTFNKTTRSLRTYSNSSPIDFLLFILYITSAK